jgi:hypothetical protein
MITLFDFIMKNGVVSQVAALPAPKDEMRIATRESIEIALVNLVPSLQSVPKNDVAVFSEGIAKLVTDNEFLKALSETVHQPSKGETEDEFVLRCNRALFAMIDERLNTNSVKK